MMQNYDKMIQKKAQIVFAEMEKRVSTEDMVRIHEAYELAREAHAEQKRKSGDDFNHIPFRHIVEVVFTCTNEKQEKDMTGGQVPFTLGLN